MNISKVNTFDGLKKVKFPRDMKETKTFGSLLSFKTIGSKIRFRYIFVIVLILTVFSTVIFNSISFNNRHNDVIKSIITANSIKDLIQTYTYDLGKPSGLLLQEWSTVR